MDYSQLGQLAALNKPTGYRWRQVLEAVYHRLVFALLTLVTEKIQGDSKDRTTPSTAGSDGFCVVFVSLCEFLLDRC